MTARAASFNARGLPFRNRNMYIYIYGFLLFLGKFFFFKLTPICRFFCSRSESPHVIYFDLLFSFIVAIYPLSSGNNVNDVAGLLHFNTIIVYEVT